MNTLRWPRGGFVIKVLSNLLALRTHAANPFRPTMHGGQGLPAVVLAALTLIGLWSVVDAASSQVTVPMTAFNNSGQSGTAKLSRSSSNHITVTINLRGELVGAKEYASIHAGTCTDMDRASRVTLNPVVEGRSITTQTSPALGPGTFAIVVRRGTGAGTNTIASCGEIELH